EFTLYLPNGARELRLKQAEIWYHKTWFSRIGGYSNEDGFYYRSSNPVMVVEFEHHSGVF
ncbi:hypothetical protein J3E74DRAFT_226844, partial [Bipolaris maydis]